MLAFRKLHGYTCAQDCYSHLTKLSVSWSFFIATSLQKALLELLAPPQQKHHIRIAMAGPPGKSIDSGMGL
jgi:hypothetical protein